MSEVELTDEANNVTLSVESDGTLYRLHAIRFVGAPVAVSLAIPKANAEKALRALIADLFVNEDVLVNLLNEATKQV
jgi:hypothetical protein